MSNFFNDYALNMAFLKERFGLNPMSNLYEHVHCAVEEIKKLDKDVETLTNSQKEKTTCQKKTPSKSKMPSKKAVKKKKSSVSKV
jgi:hypothetical protein